MPDHPPSALVKGLNVLEAVLRGNTRLSDISRAVGLANSTAHRILTDLVDAGWVSQDAKHRYSAGSRPYGLVLMLEEDSVVNTVMPFLRHLRESTGLTVHLGLCQDSRLVYRAKLDGQGSHAMKSRVGMEMQFHSTAIGKAMLSTMTAADAKGLVLKATARRLTPRTLDSVPALFMELNDARRRGWAFEDGENDGNVRCIAVPLLDADSRPMGGISLSVPGDDVSRRKLFSFAPKLVAVGVAASAALANSATRGEVALTPGARH